MEQNYSKALALLEKFHAGKCTPEELELLDNWYRSIDQGEEIMPVNQALSDQYQQQFLLNFRQATEKPKPRYRRWIAAAAAAVLIGVGISYLLLPKKNHPAPNDYLAITNTDTTPKLVVLPDSSQVWLNTTATIRYKKNFDLTHRQIQLTGEAYFDVKGDEKNPFVIRTRDINIRVLGTQFNVEAYPGEELSRVILSRGKVNVRSAHDSSVSVVLKPGYAASFSNEGRNFDIDKVNTLQTDSWKHGAFSANDISFKDAVNRLCGHYGYTVNWQNTKDINKHVNVLLNNTDFRNVLSNLCYINRKNYRISDKQVTIY